MKFVSCPFCGRGEFSKPFIKLQLDGLYRSARLTAEQNEELQKALADARLLVAKTKLREKNVKRYAHQKALRMVAQFLKHYELTPLPQSRDRDPVPR